MLWLQGQYVTLKSIETGKSHRFLLQRGRIDWQAVLEKFGAKRAFPATGSYRLSKDGAFLGFFAPGSKVDIVFELGELPPAVCALAGDLPCRCNSRQLSASAALGLQSACFAAACQYGSSAHSTERQATSVL